MTLFAQGPPTGLQLHSLQVGRPVERAGVFGAPAFVTGFIKRRAEGPVRLEQSGLLGDGQGDLVNHGGPDKAVCAYPYSRYPYWSEELESALEPGAFGENFTLAGCDENSVCLGDRYRVGAEVVVEVSQPRSPCWKLAQIHRVKDLAYRFQLTGFTGWYFRVIVEGEVESGDRLVRLARPFPRWTISRVNGIVYDRRPSRDDLLTLADCEPLTESWKAKLRRRAETGLPPDDRPRLRGPGR